jgi:argininosuccinate synthase
MKNNKVVLAFSGGLDTSFCVKYLTIDKGMEVHAFTVNTGGFSEIEIKELEKKALSLGAKSFSYAQAETSFFDQCIRYLIFGNILKNQTYPLSVSAERMFQALEVANYAKKIGAGAIAHGSTGAGNDQVRFDLVFNILAPEMEIITPIRDLKLSRQQEIEYLDQHGFQLSWEKAKYSINKGLWGTSVGGQETLGSRHTLPEEAYPSPCIAKTPVSLCIGFEKGVPISIDGQGFENPVQLIKKLSDIASPFAIGRDIHVGDTIIGIKGRVGFEAPSALILIKAHHLLEKHTLTKWQQYWKEQLANWYGMLLHEGQYLDPVMRNIEGFLEDTQHTVSGNVFVRLNPYRFELEGIDSPYDLMNSGFGAYGEMNDGWSGDDVKGFTKILGLQSTIFEAVKNKNNPHG